MAVVFAPLCAFGSSHKPIDVFIVLHDARIRYFEFCLQNNPHYHAKMHYTHKGNVTSIRRHGYICEETKS
ncbi:hypothetical protein L873DRAFT_1810960 [Choiromyces venosus 120613-1]|uniref:Uncharacterized protein n=1 Tax=Choiromyces venosus 120613-1 TaxID=1336337 RepID=A0A3N4JED0_9PEZI|nr:hypothetical protein L873DRAFT_1810960 [Choiromyces venosus 120613-1]